MHRKITTLVTSLAACLATSLCATSASAVTAYENPAGLFGAVGSDNADGSNNSDGVTNVGAYTGAFGHRFDVNAPIQITSIGLFDSAQDGINRDITIRLWDRNSQTELTSVLFGPSGVQGTLVGGSRFFTLVTPITLNPGFQGTISAENYGDGEPFGHRQFQTQTWTTNNAGGALTFIAPAAVGGAGAYPSSNDGSAGTAADAFRYAGGTFEYAVVPEPSTYIYLAAGGALCVFLRRRK